MRGFKFLMIFFGALIFLFSCQQKKRAITKGFYYWKTGMEFSNNDLQRLADLKIQKMFVRFFDVHPENNKPVPLAKINMRTRPPASVEIIPVVFITNKTFSVVNIEDLDSLAIKIARLINETAAINKIKYHEIQLDCDWTLATKEQYFRLLLQIKHELPEKIISCTIRLHQVKYFTRTGVPPVDKGMLMFYNMGELQSMHTNSIFNSMDANKYAPSVKKYPLPLDAALPLFGWVKHFGQSKLISLLNQSTEADLQKDTSFAFTSGHCYKVLKNMFYQGEYLRQGDRLVAEEITPELAKEAALLLKKYFKSDSTVVVLYHWDQLNLSRYDDKDIENIYAAFE